LNIKQALNRLIKAGQDKDSYSCNFVDTQGQTLPGELLLIRTGKNHETSQWMALCKPDAKHHEIEQKLAKTTRLLTSIIEHIPTPLFIKNATDLSFVMFNKGFEKITGLTNESVIGKTDYDFFPKEQADFFTSIDRQVIENCTIYDVEEELSSQRDAPILLRTIKVCIPDDEGSPVFLLGISEDITDRKKAEELLQNAYHDLEEKVALRTRELTLANESLKQEIQERREVERSLETTQKYLYSIMNRLPIMVYALDNEGTCIFSEGKGLEIMGYYPGQMVGVNILELYKNKPATYEKLLQAINGKRSTSISTHNDIILETTLIPNLTEEGKPDGCYGVSYDVTQLKKSEEMLLKVQNELETKVQERTLKLTQANQQLKKLDQMRRGLVSTLTHDLKTPLIAQTRVLHLIQTEASKINNETISILTSGFIKNNTDLLKMINHMLETYELEDGRVNLSLEPVSLVDTANNVCDELAHLALSKKITLQNNIQESIPRILADSLLMKRLLNNLLGNAIEHIPTGSTIQLSAQVNKTGLEISISDNGKGIEPKILPLLFTDHLARSVTKRKLGTGLGLYICKMIMALHKGGINAESTVSQGSRFYFWFPNESFCDEPTKDYNTHNDQSGHADNDATTHHLTNC
jgi:PAS domain S-box-containing protein